MQKIKVALAEDHEIFKNAFLRAMKTETDLDFMLIAKNGQDLLKQLETKKPDVILMDINMPVMDGVTATKEVMKRYGHIKIIAFTTFEDEGLIIGMSKLGIKSFVGKNQAEEIPKAIRIVNDGGVFYPDKIAKIINDYLIKTSDKSTCPFELTETELFLVQEIARGRSSSQIGDALKKSHRTIEKYRNQLYEKFDVSNKEQFIVKATRWGLLK